jgi:hypothetical protein
MDWLPFFLTDPIMLCPPDQIWSHRGIVKLICGDFIQLGSFCELWVAPLPGLLCPFLFSPGPQPHSWPTAVLVDELDPSIMGDYRVHLDASLSSTKCRID